MQSMMMDMMAGEDLHGMDMAMMQDMMEACAACEQATTMCADMCAVEGEGTCAAMCMNMADVSHSMMRMMMRPAGFSRDAMMAMMNATMVMARLCAEECMKHAEMMEHCRLCATACMQCAEAMERMHATL